MRTLLIAVALAVPTIGSAQRPIVQAAPQAPVNPARLAAARRLLQVIDIQGQMNAMAPRLAQAVAAQAQQAFGNKMPAELRAKLGSAMELYIYTTGGSFSPALIDQIAAIYARHFELAELQRLTVLMQDPALAKYRAETPGKSAEMIPLVMTALRPQQEALQTEMRQIVADWLRDHPEDKAKLASPAAH